ncbi:MAG: hypothetical protein OXC40_01210 [Proteobacteria bacterium]|nr:hypothetical protein [Pseudomonadota bacterium]
MGSGRCPHYVRHSTFNRKTQQMEFRDQCGLLLRRAAGSKNIKNSRGSKPPPVKKNRRHQTVAKIENNDDSVSCDQLPFTDTFHYFDCPTYQETFKSGSLKNNAVPTKNIQYSDQFSSNSLNDMDML